jgi:hypothetical protein
VIGLIAPVSSSFAFTSTADDLAKTINKLIIILRNSGKVLKENELLAKMGANIDEFVPYIRQLPDDERRKLLLNLYEEKKLITSTEKIRVNRDLLTGKYTEDDILDALRETGKAASNARRRMTNFEMQIIESGRKAKFSGQEFVKRDDLFDSTFIDAAGRSNVDRMKQGLAPLDKDGNPINLHHMKQQNNGIVAEVSHREHKEFSVILHRYAGKHESQIDRAAFDKLRSSYWKYRAKEFE